jgi:hypothetical protein
MGNVSTVTCRSYSAQEFDGCPYCVDAALEAVTQAGIYLVGQSAPNLAVDVEESGSLEMAFRLKVRLLDEDDQKIAGDEIRAEQTISAVAEDDEWDQRDVAGLIDGEARDPWSDDSPAGSMRLDDFQTALDLLALEPSGFNGISGAIRGRLFGYERSVCRFEIEVLPSF